jgi:hypothetical protein
MRISRIAKDSQAKTFNFRSVECIECGEHVALEEDRDYDLTKWNKHKTKCPKFVNLPRFIVSS